MEPVRVHSRDCKKELSEIQAARKERLPQLTQIVRGSPKATDYRGRPARGGAAGRVTPSWMVTTSWMLTMGNPQRSASRKANVQRL